MLFHVGLVMRRLCSRVMSASGWRPSAGTSLSLSYGTSSLSGLGLWAHMLSSLFSAVCSLGRRTTFCVSPCLCNVPLRGMAYWRLFVRIWSMFSRWWGGHPMQVHKLTQGHILFYLIFFFLLIYVYGYFVCRDTWASHTCLVPAEARRGRQILWSWSTEQ